MKIQICIPAIICLLSMSCNGLEKDEVKAYIPGIYIRLSEHEFGKEYDTLVVSELKDEFQITRKWKYERVLDGVKQEPEYKQEITTASYDNERKLLHEKETGNTMSLDAKEAVLFIGPTKYKKLK